MEIIEFTRHREVASVYWIASSVTDIIGKFVIILNCYIRFVADWILTQGMIGICVAFIWEGTSIEIPAGVIGAVILLISDIFGAYSASLLGLSNSEDLGVVVLWFSSSCVSMCGCIALGACYFRYPW
jgi:hypothetical protein